MKVTQWENCYSNQWRGLIIPEAMGHPAKFSPGLIKRIFEHCLEQGYVEKGDLCCDPFGGIGGGGIFAAPMGLKWVGCELEPRFVDMAERNFSLHRRAWETMGYPMPVILRGDSRELSRVLGETDLICTSPPHGDTNPAQSSSGINIEKQWQTYRSQGGGMSLEKFRNQQKRHSFGYGSSDGQIGAMKSGSVDLVCSSPPFVDCGVQGGGGGRVNSNTQVVANRHKDIAPKQKAEQFSYADNTPGQIGNLRNGNLADMIATLPPFMDCEPTRDDNFRYKGKPLGSTGDHYGSSPCQIGNEKSTSYWSACADVYRECCHILKPGGVIVLVLKSYIKAGRRVPLPMQTLKLLIHLGFTPIERIKAMLVKEDVTPGLFGEIRKVTERKSFFRRLHEKRYPNLKIDYEEVLILRKPKVFPFKEMT